MAVTKFEWQMRHYPSSLGSEMSMSRLLYLLPLFYTFLNFPLIYCPLVILLVISIVQSLFLFHCVFEDLDSKQTIGSGRVTNGLYLLEYSVDLQLSTTCFSRNHECHLSNKDRLMHLHNRFGHLPFSSLLVLFLSLFGSRDEFDIHCEVC